MFTATITEKSFFNGDLKVTVQFTDGTQIWKEIYSVTSEANLNETISRRLDVLDGLEILSGKLVLGAWTKPVVNTPQLTELEIATQVLYDLKRKIEIGVMKETDPEFIAAITAYKTAANK